MAILLRTGTAGRSAVEIADELIGRFGSLDGLARADTREMARVKGIGRTKAVQIKAAFELGTRWARDRAEPLPMDSPEQVEAFWGEEMRLLDYESLRVIVLDARYRLKVCKEISRGTLNETVAHPRDVLEAVLLGRGYGFIIVHNHPSGDPAPSRADHAFTLQVREASRLMQVHFIDHIILGKPTATRPGYYSFRHAGYV